MRRNASRAPIAAHESPLIGSAVARPSSRRHAERKTTARYSHISARTRSRHQQTSLEKIPCAATFFFDATISSPRARMARPCRARACRFFLLLLAAYFSFLDFLRYALRWLLIAEPSFLFLRLSQAHHSAAYDRKSETTRSSVKRETRADT